jgi:hypothetical protein
MLALTAYITIYCFFRLPTSGLSNALSQAMKQHYLLIINHDL